jgi:DNA-binding CsgD family transcriptional regulator
MVRPQHIRFYGTSMKTPKPDLREPPVYVVLIDNRGVITDVNTQGKPSARTDNAVVSQYTTGQSYLDHCRDDEHRAEVQALLKRKRTLISFVVSTRLQRQQRWFVVVGVPVGDIGGGAILMHIEITAWIPAGKDGGDASRSWQPEALNPALIQDTIAKALAKQFSPATSDTARTSHAHADVDSLSPRQREVLLLVAAGKSNLEIAEDLSCSLNTVKRHVTAVLQKLHLPNRTRAAMLANQLKLGPRFK